MKCALQIGLLGAAVLTASAGFAQGPATSTQAAAEALAAKESWQFSLTVDGYIVPKEQGYASPVLTADHSWLHLEARYNDENIHTGSLWLGYNFTVGKKLVLTVTPMVGGVFGRTTGVSPGCDASLTYKKLEFSISNEYVFDTSSKAGNVYTGWPELTYSVLDWLKVGLAAQHTKAYRTPLATDRGFLVGVSHKKVEFTTYVLNAGWTDPTVLLEIGYQF
jgi:hypothetical protein